MLGPTSPTERRRRQSGVHGAKILRRFGIRGKLNILLLLALAAVLLVSVPFVAGQIDNARSAGDTANSARDAQELGGLIWELQRERLVTAAYLATPNAASIDLAEQQRKVDSSADEVQTALGPDASDELAASLVRLGSLREPRQSALLRGISLDRVARTYHAVIGALIDALRLVPQDTGDAEGTRQLAALDALLRANEFNARARDGADRRGCGPADRAGPAGGRVGAGAVVHRAVRPAGRRRPGRRSWCRSTRVTARAGSTTWPPK